MLGELRTPAKKPRGNIYADATMFQMASLAASQGACDSPTDVKTTDSSSYGRSRSLPLVRSDWLDLLEWPETMSGLDTMAGRENMEWLETMAGLDTMAGL